jgi:thiol:disulfide interchange protein DsbD
MLEILTVLERALRSGSLLAYPAAFCGGLLASLSPCVYPLVPVTVAYIGSRSAASAQRGFILTVAYVIGIASTYAALGGLAALSGNLFGRVAAHPLTSLGMGVFLVIMAFFQLDLLTFSLPIFSAKSTLRKPGGVCGAFVVGLLSGLVISPCTVPVFGSLLIYVASRANVMYGMSLMFTFALGMGTLLIVAGTFTSLIGRMPRSGQWLVIIRKSMGILLLSCGAYYLIQSARLF